MYFAPSLKWPGRACVTVVATLQRPGSGVPVQQVVARPIVETTLCGLFTVGREDDLPDASVERRHVAECTRLAGGDQERVVKMDTLAMPARIADGDHLGVRGRIMICLRKIDPSA